MRRAIELTVFFLALVSSSWAGSPAVVLPDWLAQLTMQPTGEFPPRTNAVVLLDETSVSYSNATEYTETYRRVVRILRPEGRDERRFAMYFLPGDKVLNIHAWSMDAAGHKFELKDKDFITGSPFGDELYRDDRRISGELPGADVGSIVAFEATILRHPIANQLTWQFQESIPVKEARYKLELPPGWEYKVFWANGPAVDPQHVGTNGSLWVKSDLPGIIDEELSPSLTALAGKMAIALYAPSGARLDSWQSIGKWNNTLVGERRVASPEITAEVLRLTNGLTSFDAKVRAIAAFMQRQVRYVAIEIGIGGFQPHFAADVFRKRYGDCKDKATLMAAMLKATGIDSRHVLVHTRLGAVHADMPNIYAFNHEILAIELPAGAPEYSSVITSREGKKFLIFDPTDEFTPLGELGARRYGSLILLCDEAGGELLRIPGLDPRKNHRERLGTFTLTPEGTLSGSVVEKRGGESASRWRAAMRELNDSERKRYSERYLGNSLKGLVLKESSLKNLDSTSEELVLSYEIAAERYAQNSGTLVLLRPRVLGNISFSLDWKNRKYPVIMGSPENQVDTYEIRIPEGYVVDDLPEPVSSDVGFASYTSHFESSGSTIRYRREYSIRDGYIPLEKLSELRRFEEMIGRDESATAVLRRK